MTAATFACVFVVLYVAHLVGDHWIQTDRQARAKGLPGWTGRRACALHVATLTATKVLLLAAVIVLLNLDVSAAGTVVGLGMDAVSHYWADRRFTLRRLCRATGKLGFYELGMPRESHDDNPSLGTGAYALDQSWHVGWLFVAALVIALL